jgi:hypothetical protein
MSVEVSLKRMHVEFVMETDNLVLKKQAQLVLFKMENIGMRGCVMKMLILMRESFATNPPRIGKP